MVQGMPSISVHELYMLFMLISQTILFISLLWMQPVDVWTKLGRRGRIKEPVGTHGTVSCQTYIIFSTLIT